MTYLGCGHIIIFMDLFIYVEIFPKHVFLEGRRQEAKSIQESKRRRYGQVWSGKGPQTFSEGGWCSTGEAKHPACSFILKVFSESPFTRLRQRVWVQDQRLCFNFQPDFPGIKTT